MRKTSFAILLWISMLVLLSCGRGKFRDAEGAKRYLSNNRTQLQAAVDEWSARREHDTFCRFSDGDYRWNDLFFKKSSDGSFSISRGSAHDRPKPDLKSTLAEANVDTADFAKWDEKLRTLQGYCIETFPIFDKNKAVDRYVVLTLQGGSRYNWVSYGYAYAPVESKAWEEIAWSAHSKDHEYGPKTWVYDIGDGWFYYVDEAR